MVVLIELANEIGVNPRKVGREYHSQCPDPKCAGRDRFIIWPAQNVKDERYWCRRCGRGGDPIQFLKNFFGLNYKDACSKLKITPKELPSLIKRPERCKPKFELAKDPSPAWIEKAEAFTQWSHQQIFKYPAAVELLKGRGFTLDSISRYKLGYNPQEIFRLRQNWGLEPELKENGELRKIWLPSGLTIPTYAEDGCLLKLKIRREKWFEGDEFPKYWEIVGSMKSPSLYGYSEGKPIIILESEFDALLVQQAAGDLCSSIALGGAQKRPDFYIDHLLRKAPITLFCLDVDEAGREAWEWWKTEYEKIILWPSPCEKSPGDAIQKGYDLRKWLMQGIPIGLINKEIDNGNT